MSDVTQHQPGTNRGKPPAASLESRVIAAGVKIVEEQGLDAGLGNVGFEEAIRRAGVARASAYRRWPNREAFLDDVLVELAQGRELSADIMREQLDLMIGSVADTSVMTNAQGRRDVVVELLRRMVELDFASIFRSSPWRIHFALGAASASLRDPGLRARVTSALAAADRARNELRAQLYAQACPLGGYRLVPPLAGPLGFRQMSEAAAALFAGFMVRAQYDPSIMEPSMELRAFGSSQPAPWTVQSHASVALLLSYIEPDPGVVWDEQRIGDLAAGLVAAMAAYTR